MSHRRFLSVAITSVSLSIALGAFAKAGDSGSRFVSVDTSRLMGSPHPEPLEAERVFPNLTFQRPLELVHAGPNDGRLFVVEQHGVIRVFPNKSDVRDATIFLSIRDIVSRRHNEEGLLGLAFHPKYQENGHFYVYYSTWPRASIVSRFTVSEDKPDQADPDSEEILLRIPQPYGNHNGGSIQFGPDGYLYIGLGDGGSASDPHENGQDLTTMLGSILRIDVDRAEEGRSYAIPKDNPFVGRGGKVRSEIWAYGFRNVWRLSFDRKTGQLWAGDVGQDMFEEVDRVVKGGNYGWNRREGFHPFDPQAPITGEEDDLLPPVAEYFHGDGESVTGGVVYRGTRLPEFDGAYFYADYLSGLVWSVPAEQREVVGEPLPVADDDDDAGMNPASTRYGRLVARTGLQISAFARDADGEMYLTAFDGGIYRLTRRESDPKRDGGAFPQKLSETGLFRDVASLTPVDGMIPYRVNVPLWSDGALKERLVALPKNRSVVFHPEEKWEFPVGTVFVKTFFKPTAGDWHGNPLGSVKSIQSPSQLTEPLDNTPVVADVPPASDVDGENSSRRPQRLETRLFIHKPDGWRGHTYLWNQEQTEARLLRGSKTRTYEVRTPQGIERRRWYFPSSVDCMACHTESAGFVLGPRTAQMNMLFDVRRSNQRGKDASGKQNQIVYWQELELFREHRPSTPDQLESYTDWRTVADADQPLSDSRSLSQLSRAYLDVNCAVCHRPDGIAKETGMDLRSQTPLKKTQLLGVKVRQGQLSPAGSTRLTIGEPNRSEILYRMQARGHRQMPPLATDVPDHQALRILRLWIEQADVGPESKR